MVYTINKAAEILNFHPKTLLRFIHEGKIKAQKAGGQWRILEEDLKIFIGDKKNKSIEEASMEIEPEKKEKVQVSAIVDIFVNTKDEAMRISTFVMAALNGKDPKYGFSRCDFVFFEDEMKARFILWGGPLFIAEILKCISVMAQRDE